MVNLNELDKESQIKAYFIRILSGLVYADLKRLAAKNKMDIVDFIDDTFNALIYDEDIEDLLVKSIDEGIKVLKEIKAEVDEVLNSLNLTKS